jgi:hypothetical protein
MAISEQQRAILIERLKKAQEAKRVKAAARKAEAEQPKAEPKPKAQPKPKAEPPKVEKVEKREIEEKEDIEIEEPVAAPTAQEIYAAPHARPTAFIQEEEEKPKKSKPMNIPEPKPVKAAKEKGYMKLKFYKEPSAKVMKKLMSMHDETSSEEEEEEVKPAPIPQPTREEAKKAYMKQMANYMFDYY